MMICFKYKVTSLSLKSGQDLESDNIKTVRKGFLLQIVEIQVPTLNLGF